MIWKLNNPNKNRKVLLGDSRVASLEEDSNHGEMMELINPSLIIKDSKRVSLVLTTLLTNTTRSLSKITMEARASMEMLKV